MRVIAVEDDPALAYLLSILPRFYAPAGGLTMVVCESAAAAIAHTSHGETFDAAVVDLHLSDGLTGIDVIGMLRGRQPTLPVVVVTALPDTDEMKMLAASMATATIDKPFDPDVLVSLLVELTGAPGRTM